MGERSKTHAMSATKTYGIWQSMLNRCRNPNQGSHQDYGARGISVCDRWLVFENFLADMGEAPPGLTIERQDNNRGYEPGNCIWATRLVQSNNRRNVHRLTYRGVTHTLRDWSNIIGVTRSALYQRMREGAPVDRVLREYHGT
jgi:hypothetical protein